MAATLHSVVGIGHDSTRATGDAGLPRPELSRGDTVLNEGGAATRSDTLVVDGTAIGANGATKTGRRVRTVGVEGMHSIAMAVGASMRRRRARLGWKLKIGHVRIYGKTLQ
jgi:hypothetical protein